MIKDTDKNLEELRHSISVWEASEIKARAEFDVARNKLQRAYTRLETLRNLRDAKLLAEQSGVDWGWLLDQSRDTIEAYAALTSELAKFDLRHSGYLPKTMQRVIQISVGEKDDADKISLKMKGIQTVLPYLTPISDPDLDGQEAVYFDLMEHTLSEYGSYSIRYIPETKEWKLLVSVYGQVRLVHTSPNLDSFMIFIQNSHPYPKGEW